MDLNLYINDGVQNRVEMTVIRLNIIRCRPRGGMTVAYVLPAAVGWSNWARATATRAAGNRIPAECSNRGGWTSGSAGSDRR